MDNIKLEDMFAVKSDGGNVLGKLLYFGLSNVLIERDKLVEICEDLELPVTVGTRISEIDSFRSATSDIYDRIVDKEYGELRVRKVYCRDNEKSNPLSAHHLPSRNDESGRVRLPLRQSPLQNACRHSFVGNRQKPTPDRTFF